MGVWFFCTFVYLRYLIIGNKKYNGRGGPISNSNYKKTSGLKNVKHKRSVWRNLLYTFEGHRVFHQCSVTRWDYS